MIKLDKIPFSNLADSFSDHFFSRAESVSDENFLLTLIFRVFISYKIRLECNQE